MWTRHSGDIFRSEGILRLKVKFGFRTRIRFLCRVRIQSVTGQTVVCDSMGVQSVDAFVCVCVCVFIYLWGHIFFKILFLGTCFRSPLFMRYICVWSADKTTYAGVFVFLSVWRWLWGHVWKMTVLFRTFLLVGINVCESSSSICVSVCTCEAILVRTIFLFFCFWDLLYSLTHWEGILGLMLKIRLCIRIWFVSE